MRITGGEHKGRSIRTTEGEGYRPATARVREAIFSMLEARGVDWPSVRVLDVFAGSGSLAIEALSRGAAEAWFIEKSPKAARLIGDNLRELGIARERWRVLSKDAAAVLKNRPEAPFGLVFVDPPYGRQLLLPALDAIARRGWLAPGGLVLAEAEDRLDLGAAVPDLEPTAEKSYGQTRIYIWQQKKADG